MNPFWCCARLHINSERIATDNLQRQEFEYYSPKILEKKVIRGKLQHVESPLFPCYLFIRVKDRWRSLQSTHGIASLIGGSSPSIVRDNVIDDLKKREMNGYIQLPKPKQFEVGDKVMISSGAFAGQQALVERMSTKDRQKVLLALLSGQMRVLIEEENLEAA